MSGRMAVSGQNGREMVLQDEVQPNSGGNRTDGSDQPEAAPEPQEYANHFKYLLIGDQTSGKSCLLQRYVHDNFSPVYNATTGVDFHNKTIRRDNGEGIKLEIWDMTGQEPRFPQLTAPQYGGSHAVLIVYTATDREQLEHVPKWLQKVETYASDAIVVIVGTKIDEAKEGEKIYGPKEVEELLKTEGVWGENVKGCFLTSACTGEGVDKPFNALTDKLVEVHNPLRAGGDKFTSENKKSEKGAGQAGSQKASKTCAIL